MSHLIIRNKNEVYVNVECDDGIAYELSDHFTFSVPGHQFNPKFRNKLWDGKIRLFSSHKREIYRGLVEQVIEYCEKNNHTYEYDSFDEEFSVAEAEAFTKTFLKDEYKPRDYQLDAFVNAIRKKRALLLSPTASGKSLFIYMLIRKYLQENNKILIIVPTINLVNQLTSDFADYGFDTDTFVHKIHGGLEKQTNKPIVISTWQSLVDMPKSFFHSFDAVIGDECHLFKAKSLTSIMTQLINAKYRVGTTGTLDGTKTHKLVLEGLFGSVKRVTTTKVLMDRKILADFEVKCLLLKHDDETCKALKNIDYATELDYLVSCEARNNFIANLACSLKGNTLILFQFIRHGETLKSIIESKVSNRNVYFIYGKTEADIREDTRKLIESETDAIIIASSGVFSTGVNIKNLHSVIFASPSKSRIRVLQSIGRVLRTSQTKTNAILFDIADNLIYKKKENFTFKHFSVRLQYYAEEKFKFKIYKVELKGSDGNT